MAHRSRLAKGFGQGGRRWKLEVHACEQTGDGRVEIVKREEINLRGSFPFALGRFALLLLLHTTTLYVKHTIIQLPCGYFCGTRRQEWDGSRVRSPPFLFCLYHLLCRGWADSTAARMGFSCNRVPKGQQLRASPVIVLHGRAWHGMALGGASIKSNPNNLCPHGSRSTRKGPLALRFDEQS